MQKSVVDLRIPVSVYHEEEAGSTEIKETVAEAVEKQLSGDELLKGGETSHKNIHRAVKASGPYPEVEEDLSGESVPDDVAEKMRREPFRVQEDIEEAKADPTRIIARYSAQEWQGEYARTVETQYWDVTVLIESMEKEKVRALRDNDHSSDQLVHPYSTHEGPHSVSVTEQIQQYHRHHNDGEPLWE